MALLVASIIGSIVVSKKRKISKDYADLESAEKDFTFSPLQIFLIGFFISATLLYFPLSYAFDFTGESQLLRIVKSFFLAIHNTMRAFLLEADFLEVKESINTLFDGETISVVYSTYAMMFSVVAPILTASFVLLMFKSISVTIKYSLNFSKNVFYISELNEKSLALAFSIQKGYSHLKPLIVFCSIDDEDEQQGDLIEKANRLGAICFAKDIISIKLKSNRKNVNRKFYFISENETLNMKQALSIIKTCKDNAKLNVKNTECYVFATNSSSEALLNATDYGNIKVRRINPQRNLVYKTLTDYSIFDNAIEENGVKKINVLIVGFGKQGIEFLKALAWYGQMTGYEITINVFDINPDVYSVARDLAPELIDFNGKRIEGEPYYKINFYGGVNVELADFAEKLKEVGQITTAYIILGNDELNIETSIKFSTEYARLYKDGLKTLKIFAVVYNSLQNKILKDSSGLKSVIGTGYDIKIIGDISKRYSIDSIEMLAEEAEALDCHLKWVSTFEEADQVGEKAKFEKYEYYRRSSMSEAIHKKRRLQLKVQGGERLDRYSSDTVTVDVLEHKRWNAYMRSEGFVCGIKKDFIAKTHQDLIPFEELTEAEKYKDTVVASI